MHHWLRPLVGGVGAILTLHHVRPPRPEGFQPNRLLEVTPEFLEGLLRRLARARIDVISLDEMHRRFIEDDFKRRFVCLTFDDGYKDFLRWAYPLLRKYRLPFAMYIADQLSGSAWRIVVDRAGSGDRAEQSHRHGGQRQRISISNALPCGRSVSSMMQFIDICAA